MSVDGRAPSRRDEIVRRWRSTGGRGRKLRGLLELLRPYRGRTLLMFAALVAGTAASLAPPPLAKLAIDDGIVPGDTGTLDLVVVAFIVSALVYWGATYAQTYLVGWVGQRVLQDLRIQLFAHLQSLSIGFYSRRQAGVIISRLTNDVQALDQLVSDGIVTLFGSSLTLVGTAVILLVLDWQLALLTFLVFPVLGIGSVAFRIISADAYRATREKVAQITAYLQETLSGVRVVRIFAQERRHEAVFSGLNDENRAANMKTVNLNAAYFPAVELLSAFVTAAILLYGGLQAIEGDVTIGVLVAFIAALNNFFDPIQQLSQLYTTYQAGMAALDKIFELLDEEPELRDRPGALELPRLRGELTFEDVSFAYSPDGERALDGIELHVPAGQTVALVGSTGAGKSTFAKLAARFYDPTEGRILVDGHDLRDVRARSLRAQMGIVPQEAFLFSGTIRDNLAFGRTDATPEEVEDAARAVGAHDFIAALEHGYDTQIGERGIQLSAGQRQLVAFARALISDPRILVLDEATSNVDIHTEGRIEEGMRRLLAGRTAIVIAHRLSTIRRAGHIVVLDRRADRRAGHARRSCSTPRAPTGASTATGPSRRRRREPASVRLARAHARVQPGLDRVGEEVREHDEQRRLDDERLHEVDVAVDQRPLDVAEAAGDVEDGLDQREVREDHVHVHADERDHRPGRGGQRVAPDDAARRDALAARGAHEVLVQRREQLRLAHARARGRQRRPRRSAPAARGRAGTRRGRRTGRGSRRRWRGTGPRRRSRRRARTAAARRARASRPARRAPAPSRRRSRARRASAGASPALRRRRARPARRARSPSRAGSSRSGSRP